jgi:hypothetical protein
MDTGRQLQRGLWLSWVTPPLAVAVTVTTDLATLTAVLPTGEGLDVVRINQPVRVISDHATDELTGSVLIAGPLGILVWLSLPSEDVPRHAGMSLDTYSVVRVVR